jgi:hypothetical protein
MFQFIPVLYNHCLFDLAAYGISSRNPFLLLIVYSGDSHCMWVVFIKLCAYVENS